jgi:hypothetical protein
MESTRALFFWVDVVVKKIIAKEINKVVWPKRLACLTGLSQIEEIIFARRRSVMGRTEGEAVKESLPLVRFLTHQATSETLARNVIR